MEWDGEWLSFSRKARRGMFFLLFLFVVIALIPRLYAKYSSRSHSSTYEITSISTSDKNETIVEDESRSRYSAPTDLFDPNTFTLEEWMATGLSQKQAQSIINYISKGGSFKVKSDLRKSYVITEELYELLEPMIALPESNKQINSFDKKETQVKVVDKVKEAEKENNLILNPISINKATIEELQFIKGVGPFFAKEIIKLRERYGGIISSNQLLEIYNMDEEKIDQIIPFLKIDKSEVVKLNINTATLEELKRHPLIHSDMAKSIVYYREQRGGIKTLDELLTTPYIDYKKLKGLEPYLKVE